MRVTVIDANEERGQHLCARLSEFPGVIIHASCKSLMEGFNSIEHRPPQLVVFSDGLSQTPEFDTMRALCRGLCVRIAVNGTRRPEWSNSPPRLDAYASPEDFRTMLAEVMKDKIVQLSQPRVGLFQVTERSTESRAILIGSSTGGIEALVKVLGTFPADCPPTLVVQHTGSGFGSGIARLLDKQVEPSVVMASDNRKLEAGCVLLASGMDAHMQVATGVSPKCQLREGARVSGHCPSVDALFFSAVPIANRVAAAVLTGMGRDGAEGLLALRKAGAKTICQDEATSVVYGMPRAAVELGAAAQVLPLNQIGSALLSAAQPHGVA